MSKEILIQSIAYARSGDKGSDVNIGVIAYKKEGYLVLKDLLTEVFLKKTFLSLNPTSVICYEMPNIWALNFLLKGVLDGGGSSSLRTDSQGKLLGQALLMKTLKIPKKYESMLANAYGEKIWKES